MCVSQELFSGVEMAKRDFISKCLKCKNYLYKNILI